MAQGHGGRHGRRGSCPFHESSRGPRRRASPRRAEDLHRPRRPGPSPEAPRDRGRRLPDELQHHGGGLPPRAPRLASAAGCTSLPNCWRRCGNSTNSERTRRTMETVPIQGPLQDRVLETLTSCPLFRALRPGQHSHLLRVTELRRYAPSETILEQGDAADAFCVISRATPASWSRGKSSPPSQGSLQARWLVASGWQLPRQARAQHDPARPPSNERCADGGRVSGRRRGPGAAPDS